MSARIPLLIYWFNDVKYMTPTNFTASAIQRQRYVHHSLRDKSVVVDACLQRPSIKVLNIFVAWNSYFPALFSLHYPRWIFASHVSPIWNPSSHAFVPPKFLLQALSLPTEEVSNVSTTAYAIRAACPKAKLHKAIRWIALWDHNNCMTNLTWLSRTRVTWKGVHCDRSCSSFQFVAILTFGGFGLSGSSAEKIKIYFRDQFD